MRSIVACLVLVVAVFVGVDRTASADVKIHKDAGISVDIPHEWKIAHPDGATMTATDPKGEAVVMFVISDGADMKVVGEGIDQMLAKIAKDVKWGPQKPLKLNGFDATSMEGTASMEGKPVNMGALIVVTAKKKGVFLLGFVEASKEKTHKAELDGILASFKPAP